MSPSEPQSGSASPALLCPALPCPALSQTGQSGDGQPPPGAPSPTTVHFTPGKQPANAHPDRTGAPTSVRGPAEHVSGVDGQGSAGDSRVDGAGRGADQPGGRSD